MLFYKHPNVPTAYVRETRRPTAHTSSNTQTPARRGHRSLERPTRTRQAIIQKHSRSLEQMREASPSLTDEYPDWKQRVDRNFVDLLNHHVDPKTWTQVEHAMYCQSRGRAQLSSQESLLRARDAVGAVGQSDSYSSSSSSISGYTTPSSSSSFSSNSGTASTLASSSRRRTMSLAYPSIPCNYEHGFPPVSYVRFPEQSYDNERSGSRDGLIFADGPDTTRTRKASSISRFIAIGRDRFDSVSSAVEMDKGNAAHAFAPIPNGFGTKQRPRALSRRRSKYEEALGF